MSNVYRNSNGNTYLILAMKKESALLVEHLAKEPMKEWIVYHPFVVARTFDQNISSWANGNYFETYEEALEFFEKITN